MLSKQLGYGMKEPDQGRGGGTGGSKGELSENTSDSGEDRERKAGYKN